MAVALLYGAAFFAMSLGGPYDESGKYRVTKTRNGQVVQQYETTGKALNNETNAGAAIACLVFGLCGLWGAAFGPPDQIRRVPRIMHRFGPLTADERNQVLRKLGKR